MPQCAGCSKYLLTKDVYCRECQAKIARGEMVDFRQTLSDEEKAKQEQERIAEEQRMKLVRRLVRENERREDARSYEETQKWKISGYVENLQVQIYNLRDSLRLNDEITKSVYSQCVMDSFNRKLPFLKFAVYCNEKYFLVSNSRMVSISKLGIDQRIAEEVEKIVRPHIAQTMPVRDLNCFGELPQINEKWTDWLVYSTLLKWSKKLSVGLSSYREVNAVPLVAPVGLLDPSSVVVDPRQRKYFVVDDLSDLDQLLEELIEWKDLQQ